jgi:hypothetical protein
VCVYEDTQTKLCLRDETLRVTLFREESSDFKASARGYEFSFDFAWEKA